MPRCAGTTQSGTRCRRDAVEGSAYCALHQDQTGDPAREAASSGAPDSYRSPTSDTLIVLGVAALTWAVLRRFFRVF